MESFWRLKQVVSVARFLDARGLSANLRRKGGRLVGPCPVHRGDNPTAFVVDLDHNTWHCFTACGGGGDVVELVRRVDRVDYAEAGRRLAAIAALPEPAPGATLPQPRQLRAHRPFQPFTRALPLDPDTPFLRAKGITAATARSFEAGQWHGQGFLAACVAVRLHDPQGRPLGYAGRRLDPDLARRYGKWKFPPRLPKAEILYGAHRLPHGPHDALAVTECPWGAMRLHQLGIPAVALLGTALSAAHRRHLAQAPRVVLVFDGDSAGVRAAQRAQAALRDTTEVQIVPLPPGCDPDDLDDGALNRLLRALFLP
ncbi:MAG: toprim domain-containing protein [Myxococcota bacterium]|nr:toprim domain-containing protein [Myxococcota bacterium]